MAQIPENIERIKTQAPYVRVATGPGYIHHIPDLVERALSDPTERLLLAVSPTRTGACRDESAQTLPEGLPRKKVQGPSAYVNIMYGCDNFCTYCIVPFVRGPQVSRKPQDIIEEAKKSGRAWLLRNYPFGAKRKCLRPRFRWKLLFC